MSSQPPILIHGAGGHAKVAYSVAISLGREVIGFLAPSSDLQSLFNLPIFRADPFRSEAEQFVAVGNNGTRKAIADSLRGPIATLIHPSAMIANDVTIGQGTLVCAGAIIQTCTSIGQNTIINTKASVDHDCRIGNFVHIAPGATLCGNITVGDQALIGAGATVIPNLEINSGATLAAGALAIEEIPRNETWVGVPAKYKP